MATTIEKTSKYIPKKNIGFSQKTANARMQPHSERKVYGVYIPSILTRRVHLKMNEIGKNLKNNLEQKIKTSTEGKCIVEGFIQPKSVNIISYSSGIINTDYIEFHAVFNCMVCHPVEGMEIENCEVKTITKAGIHAEVVNEDGVIPITVFLARDHHVADTQFNNVKENAKLRIKVIGIRYELNDPYISVIGKLIDH